MAPKATPPVVDEHYLAGRKTLVKALHTRTTVSRLAVYLIETGVFGRHYPKSAVDKALEIIGQNGEWRDDDPVYAKCIASTKELLAARRAG